MKPILAIVLSLLCLISITVYAAPPPPQDISALLTPIIEKRDVPGMAAAVVHNGEVVSLGVAGVRMRGKPDKIAAADRFHIGSDTKAMTAMLCGILVDEGKLKWEQTLGETFPELKKSMHPQYQAVTLEQLLTNRSGAPCHQANWQKMNCGASSRSIKVRPRARADSSC
jgi:CubicO group peptidase (beta-lactamase class C family)